MSIGLRIERNIYEHYLELRILINNFPIFAVKIMIRITTNNTWQWLSFKSFEVS